LLQVRGRKPSLETLAARHAFSAQGEPVCPAWLDDDARAEWGRILPELSKQYSVSPVDMILLATYCQLASDYQQLVLQIRKQGQTILSQTGEIKVHPAANLAAKCAIEIRRIAGEFGFSPAARMHLKATPPVDEEADELNSFIG
jgi:P27 family predicted phage terminase small subunit